MTVRQRPNADTAGSAQTPLIPSNQYPEQTAKPTPLPWYRYPLNLFIARSIRYLGLIGFWHHARKYNYEPKSIPYSRKKSIRARDGYEIVLTIYDPSSSPARDTKSPVADPICVVNFHGGGFAIGSSTDDSRWANSCTQAGYTFISVEYRLAPEYPYPVPVEDCVDATKYVLDHMGEFTPPSTSGPEVQGKVVLSGFSAGGSLAVTTALSLLNPSLDSTSMPSSSSSDNAQEGPYQSSILGLIPFYPVLDWYTPRTAKLGPGVVALPGWLTKMFDTSYLPPTVSIPRTHPLISPLLAPDSMLRKLPGVHLCLCSLDSLGREGGVFGDKLGQRDLQGERERERDVCVRWVEGAKHGWDKPPHPLQASVKVEYDAAVASIKRWQSTSG